jgi:hypothetical protein
MHRLSTLLIMAYLAGCSPAYINGTPNENSPYFQLPVGSEIQLERPVEVPAGRDQLYFQNGRTMDWHEVDIYLPHCALQVSSKREATRPVQPDVFMVTDTYTERFFKQVRTPTLIPAIKPAAFGAMPLAGGDIDLDGGMDYEVVAVIMTLHSEHQPQVTSMTCADWGLPQDTVHITVHKIRRALDGFFTVTVHP